MKIRGIDFVLLPVSDLARATRFYRETLGLQLELFSEEHQWAEFHCGNVTLALKGGATAPPNTEGPRLALSVDDVSTACEELLGKGVVIIDGPTNHDCCWSAEIRDPDGNSVVLHHRADGSWGHGPV